jgi:hypothetical protein
MFESVMPDPDRLHEIAVASDRTVERVRERILELLTAATAPADDVAGECDRLQACFGLEPYGVFPAGSLVDAPTESEYAEYRAEIVGEVQKISPELRGTPPKRLTLAQIQADDFSALDT